MIKRNNGLFGDEEGSSFQSRLKATPGGTAALPEKDEPETEIDEETRLDFEYRDRACREEDEYQQEQQKYIRDEFIRLFGRIPTRDQIWARTDDHE